MRASNMFERVQGNTRKYEKVLRDVERRLSDANAKELQLDQRIAVDLTAIANLHLEHTPSLEQDARQQLELRAQEEESMRAQLVTVEEGIAVLQRNLSATIDMAADIEARVTAELAATPAFADLKKRHAELVAAHAEAEASCSDIVSECARKLAPFGNDRLYAYVVASGFGTTTYARTGVFRFLDGWVANLCNFHQNRANELMLIAMQGELKKASDERTAAIQSLAVTLDAMVSEARAKTDLESLAKKQSGLESDIAREKKRANDIHEVLHTYATKTDARYAKARGMVADALKARSPESLLDLVERTPGLEDDEIAKRVIRTRAELKAHRAGYPDLHGEREKAQRDYDKAKGLERKLKSSDYSSNNYEYNDLDIGSVILGYMTGRLTTDSAVSQVRQHRQEVEVETPSYSSSSSSSFGSSWSSSSSSSSDSFSSSSSSGGGSYSTSDSF